MNITVVGSGAYGLALTLQLYKNKTNKITVWTESNDIINEITSTHTYSKALPDIIIPSDLKLTTSFADCIPNADVIFIMVTSKYLSSVISNIRGYINKKAFICIGTKGIDESNALLQHEILRSYIKTKRFAVISGPSFAIDIANNHPIGLTLASPDKKTLAVIKNVLETNSLKVFRMKDYVGVEMCGAIKNVIAIAAGILDGLKYSESSQALLITESINDLNTLITAMGGSSSTVINYCGIGDIVLTATRSKSRNYAFGQVIGQSKNNSETIAEHLKTHTVEGYYTTRALYKFLQRKNVSVPLISCIYNIVVNNQNPLLIVDYISKKN